MGGECSHHCAIPAGGLLQKLSVAHLLSCDNITQLHTYIHNLYSYMYCTSQITYLERAMSENLVLHESEQKETDCIPLMKAGSLKNLDHKINRYTVMQPSSEHKNSKYMYT